KRVHLELGGNSAVLVLPDVDVSRAARAAAWSTYLHQGQICMATGRHLVHEQIYEEYLSEVIKIASEFENNLEGDGGLRLGPIIDENQRDQIHHLVTQSVNEGAELHLGGDYEGQF